VRNDTHYDRIRSALLKNIYTKTAARGKTVAQICRALPRELFGAFLLLKHAAEHREEWLQRFYAIGKEAVRPRKKGELWGFAIGSSTKSYLALDYALQKAGVETEYCFVGKHSVSKFVRLAQPYGGFAKAILEQQHYPDLRDSSGHPITPYDVTAHSVSLLTGVSVRPLRAPFRCRAADWCDDNHLPSYELPKRLALYRSSVPTIDEGWTRFTLLQNGRLFPNDPVDESRLTQTFDLLRDQK
jgi:hypothetical protein